MQRIKAEAECGERRGVGKGNEAVCFFPQMLRRVKTKANQLICACAGYTLETQRSNTSGISLFFCL